MSLKGAADLKKRLNAGRLAFKPLGKEWADDYVQLAKPSVPSRTGRLRRSFRVQSSTKTRARVAGHFTAYFIDAGPKPHTIKAKGNGRLIFQAGGNTIFTRQVHHRGYRARPFRVRVAREAMRRNPPSKALIDAWNKAA